MNNYLNSQYKLKSTAKCDNCNTSCEIDLILTRNTIKDIPVVHGNMRCPLCKQKMGPLILYAKGTYLELQEAKSFLNTLQDDHISLRYKAYESSSQEENNRLEKIWVPSFSLDKGCQPVLVPLWENHKSINLDME